MDVVLLGAIIGSLFVIGFNVNKLEQRLAVVERSARPSKPKPRPRPRPVTPVSSDDESVREEHEIKLEGNDDDEGPPSESET